MTTKTKKPKQDQIDRAVEKLTQAQTGLTALTLTLGQFKGINPSAFVQLGTTLAEIRHLLAGEPEAPKPTARKKPTVLDKVLGRAEEPQQAAFVEPEVT